MTESDKIAAIGAGIGFFGAILGAIVGGSIAGYFSLKTTDKLLDEERLKRETEKTENVRALLSVLNAELIGVWNLYMADAGGRIDALPEGQAFKYYFPILGDYFPVYHSSVASLGLLPDDALRHKIISTYNLAEPIGIWPCP